MQLLFRCRRGCLLLVFLLKLEEVLVQRGGSAKDKFRHRSHYGVRMNQFGVQQTPVTIARVALYARVSTLNGQDPEMQLRELREYAARRGWSVEKEYIDQGVSG